MAIIPLGVECKFHLSGIFSMPEISYWPKLAYFAISVLFIVWGARDMLLHKKKIIRYAFWPIAVMFFLLGLNESVKQEKGLTPVVAFSSVDNLSSRSNAQLRDQVLQLTSAMRTFENGIQSARTNRIMNRLPVSATKEQRQANWEAETQAMLDQSTNAQTEFRVRFLPEALALREEMSKRLGRLPPYQDKANIIALDYGMLAGVSPISDAANYLDGLARQLPQ